MYITFALQNFNPHSKDSCHFIPEEDVPFNKRIHSITNNVMGGFILDLVDRNCHKFMVKIKYVTVQRFFFKQIPIWEDLSSNQHCTSKSWHNTKFLYDLKCIQLQ